MSPIERVETRRLLATRPELDDAAELQPVFADPRVAEWLWPDELGGPRTLEQTREILAADIGKWDQDGFGPWVVRDKDTRQMVGRAGLKRSPLEGEEVVEIGYAIASSRWREGLASEIVAASIRAAFDDLAIPELVAFTQHHNAASRRVMERAGMTFEREVIHAGLPHVLYVLRP